MGRIRTILSLLAYVPSTLATIFDFELEQKKLPFEVIGIHNALPCSALAEAYGQKQKNLFEDQIKKLHFLYILKN